MSDVVERLRDYRTEDETRHSIEHELCFEAADEIVRLRAELASAVAAERERCAPQWDDRHGGWS